MRGVAQEGDKRARLVLFLSLSVSRYLCRPYLPSSHLDPLLLPHPSLTRHAFLLSYASSQTTPRLLSSQSPLSHHSISHLLTPPSSISHFSYLSFIFSSPSSWPLNHTSDSCLTLHLPSYPSITCHYAPIYCLGVLYHLRHCFYSPFRCCPLTNSLPPVFMWSLRLVFVLGFHTQQSFWQSGVKGFSFQLLSSYCQSSIFFFFFFNSAECCPSLLLSMFSCRLLL